MALVATEREFSAYGLSHWLVLVVFAAGAALVVYVGRRHRSTAHARRFSRMFAVTIFALTLADLLYEMFPASIERSVPLHLSDLVPLVAAYALFFHRQWAYALTYYWGLVLSTQALISPALTGPDFPHVNFLFFWGSHLLVIWAALYLTWGRGMRTDWRSYRTTLAVTAAWAAVAMTFNFTMDTNYGFLNRKSDTVSALDLLGPWPWYLLAVAALLAAVWALLTLLTGWYDARASDRAGPCRVGPP
ncbi:YwaF family protein [Haloechinothrix halophila]|uniref:YwaF family protein n=1 Tax=Haloechinothrix halophila TaxID=1069073 RepID=UPI000404659B|nr:TIGR02206 family membrane protein [Haloechinothrix halophila]